MATQYERLGPLQTTARTTTVRSISGAADMDTKLPTSDEFKKLRQMYADLYNNIGQTYINLANAGRTNEALQLKEAAERFSRAGSSLGLSPMARAAALTSLQTAMRAAGMQQEAANAAQSLAAQTSTLSSLTGAEQQQFRDEISRYNAALNALPQTTVTTEMQAARPIQDQISTVVKSPTVNRARQALDARLAAASAKPTAMAGPLPTSGGYVAPKTSTLPSATAGGSVASPVLSAAGYTGPSSYVGTYDKTGLRSGINRGNDGLYQYNPDGTATKISNPTNALMSLPTSTPAPAAQSPAKINTTGLPDVGQLSSGQGWIKTADGRLVSISDGKITNTPSAIAQKPVVKYSGGSPLLKPVYLR